MESYYRINVAKNGKFYFRSDDPFFNDASAKAMAKDFRDRFPAAEGFEVSLTFWRCQGTVILEF